MMSEKVKIYDSAKDMRMYPYEVTNALYRKERALQKVRTLEFEGIHLQTEQKRAHFQATIRTMKTVDLDHLMKVFNNHFDDYTLKPNGSRIKVVCEVFYGIDEQ